MAQVQSNEEALKQAVKDAFAETLYEQREFLHNIFAEVLEDFALAESIREGRETKFVARDELCQY